MSTNERRNFFRLSNKVHIGLRKATEAEVKAFLKQEGHLTTDSLDITYLFDQLSRQMSPLLINIRQESPAVAQYLELLNQKIDLITSSITMQQFEMDAAQGDINNVETTDISEGGFSFKSHQSFDIGSFLFCKIIIVGYRLGLETYGKVVRSKAGKQAGSYQVAVELPYLNELDKKNLTRYILDKQREQLRKRASD